MKANKKPRKTPRHGMCGSRTYSSWAAMLTRCSNQKHQYYRFYGGKGISVCKSWHKFIPFYRDMGKCPEGYSLDRIDINGNYEKGNCRWATPEEQAQNTSRTRKVSLEGKTRSLAFWCKELNLSYSIVSQRINKLGWTPMQAISGKKYSRRIDQATEDREKMRRAA